MNENQLRTAPLAHNDAVVTRLRTLLERLRASFSEYLLLLEHEEAAIVNGDIEKLEQHIRIEQRIVAEILALRRVIAPLEEMYTESTDLDVPDIPALRDSLDRMHERVRERTARNRALLRDRMTATRLELSELRVPAGRWLSDAADDPSLFDVTG